MALALTQTKIHMIRKQTQGALNIHTTQIMDMTQIPLYVKDNLSRPLWKQLTTKRRQVCLYHAVPTAEKHYT